MNRKEKNKYKKIVKISNSLKFTGLSLFILMTISLIFIDDNIIEKSQQTIKYITIIGYICSVILIISSEIIHQHYSNKLKAYSNSLRKIRSARNFKNGLQWMKEGRLMQAINVYDTIVNKNARSFYYHIFLITTMSSDNEYSELCKEIYSSLCIKYSNPLTH